MKTTVKLKLRASRRMPGCGVLVLRVTRGRVTRTMTTSCVLSLDEWDENQQSIIFLENISSKRKKELTSIKSKLKKGLQKLHETAGMLESRGDYSSQELLQCYRNRQQLFCAYVLRKSEILCQDERFGTAHTYRYAAVSFLKFLGNKDVHIEKINAPLMEDFEHYLLAKGRSKNTVSCYMRALRAVYNLAVREKVFVIKKAGENPFSRVFTSNAKTRKRAISRESISQLIRVKLQEAKGKADVYSLVFSRDLFLFSFYTQGMSFSDMADLKKENIKEGVIRYHRKKTGQLITIELEDCMREIIERYAESNSDFIFPILGSIKGYKGINGFKDYERWKKTAIALASYNKNLKKLAALVGIEEHLTSYVSRHSWASMASQEGIPISTISRSMGHESERTTRIYISQTDYSDVGRANRQILSYFFSQSTRKEIRAAPLR